ncbi:hypothetical protein TW85_07505 [Marinomonas sp. S3726]|nr:hypothetical protein TW85_07505 [Marinomonas sp. S3726]
MAEVTLGWLLLDSMMVAKRVLVANDSPEPKKAESSLEPEEQAFYQGKIQSGLFFMNNTLPNVFAKAQVIALEDDSAEEASAEMFLSRREV